MIIWRRFAGIRTVTPRLAAIRWHTAAIMSLCGMMAALGLIESLQPREAAALAPNLAEQLCTVIDHQVTGDDARVVFSSYQGDYEDRDQGGIYTVPLTGGDIEKINNSATDNNLNSAFLLSENGAYTVYLAGDTIYSAPVEGGQSVELASKVDSLADVAISADGLSIIYISDADTSGGKELYSVPTLGGQITPLWDGGNVSHFEFLNTSSEVVFTDSAGSSLHVASVDGSSAITVSDSAETNISFVTVAPNSSRITYVATNGSITSLYSINPDGSNKLTLKSVLSETFRQVAISPNSARAVYLLEDNFNIAQLYSVSLAGGPTAQLNGSLVAGGSLVNHPIQISPDSSFVIYLADQQTNGVVELFQAAIGGGSVSKLNGPLTSGGNVGGAEHTVLISPNSQYVYYLADQEVNDKFELYSVALSSGAVTKLNPALGSSGDVERLSNVASGILVTPNSNHVIFGIRPNAGQDEFQLHSATSASGWVAQLNDEADPSGLTTLRSIPRATSDSSRIVFLNVYGTDASTILRYNLRSETPNGNDAIDMLECAVGLNLANHMLIVDNNSFRDFDWTSRALASTISTQGHATYSRIGSRLLLTDLSAAHIYSWPLLQPEQQHTTKGRGFIRFIDDQKLILIDDNSLNNLAWPSFGVTSSAPAIGRPDYHFVGDRILVIDGNGVNQYYWPGLQFDGTVTTIGKPDIQFVSSDRLLVKGNNTLSYVEWPSLFTLYDIVTDGKVDLQFLSNDEILIRDDSSLRILTWPTLEPVHEVATHGRPTIRFSSTHLVVSDSTQIQVFEWPSMTPTTAVNFGSSAEITFASDTLLFATTDDRVQLMTWPALALQTTMTTTGRGAIQFVNESTVLLTDNDSVDVYSWPAMQLQYRQMTNGIPSLRFSGSDSLLVFDSVSMKHYDFPTLALRNQVSTTGKATIQFITSETFILKDDLSLRHYSWPSMATVGTPITTTGESSFERVGDRLLVADEQSLRIYKYAALDNLLTLATTGQAGFRIVNNQLVVLDRSQLTIFDWETLAQVDQQSTTGQASVCIYAPIANCLEVPDSYAPTFITNDPQTGSAIITPAMSESLPNNGVLFNWHPASDINAVTYELQISGTLARSGVYSTTVTTPYSTYTPAERFEDGAYSWTVRAVDEDGNHSAWQPMEPFNIQTKTFYLPIMQNQ